MSSAKKQPLTRIRENNQPITFDMLPESAVKALNKLDHIIQILEEKEPESFLSRPITTRELCKWLGVTEVTILRYRKRGLIPYYSIGSAIRFDLQKVIKSLENKKIKK